MLNDDGPANGQTKPRSDAAALGGKPWVEELRYHLFGNARSGIFENDIDGVLTVNVLAIFHTDFEGAAPCVGGFNHVPCIGDDVQENLHIMSDLISKTIETVKKISFELRPPILNSFSLSEAIEWQGRSFENRTGIKFELSSFPENIRLDQERSTTIFRIFQECLTNIVRHANASKVNVEISDQNEMVVLFVKDNGIGIKKENIENRFSLGILGMRERAQLFGGNIALHGNKDKGTEITITIKH